MAHGRRRDAILAAARSEFARYGFAGARIERIAAAAAVNKQLIFHYFRSKDGLHTAAVSAVFATWQPAQDAGAPPSERLRQVVAHLVQWLHENAGAAHVIADIDRLPTHQTDVPSPSAEAKRWLENAKGAVRSAVEGGQRQGYFRDDVDPQVVADIVASSALGHVMTAGIEGDATPAESLRLIENLSRAMVEYCAWR